MTLASDLVAEIESRMPCIERLTSARAPTGEAFVAIKGGAAPTQAEIKAWWIREFDSIFGHIRGGRCYWRVKPRVQQLTAKKAGGTHLQPGWYVYSRVLVTTAKEIGNEDPSTEEAADEAEGIGAEILAAEAGNHDPHQESEGARNPPDETW